MTTPKKTSRPSGMSAEPKTPVATPIPAKPTPNPILDPDTGELVPLVVDGVPSTTMPTSSDRVRVTATQDGYYDDRYLRDGDIFDVHPDHFAPKWMRHVAPSSPKKVTTSAEALDKERGEIRGARAMTLAGHTVPGQETDIDNPEGLDPLGADNQGD